MFFSDGGMVAMAIDPVSLYNLLEHDGTPEINRA